MRGEGPNFELSDEYYFLIMVKFAFVIVFEVSSGSDDLWIYLRFHRPMVIRSKISWKIAGKPVLGSIIPRPHGHVCKKLLFICLSILTCIHLDQLNKICVHRIKIR